MYQSTAGSTAAAAGELSQVSEELSGSDDM